jgi:hypothetical protein
VDHRRGQGVQSGRGIQGDQADVAFPARDFLNLNGHVDFSASNGVIIDPSHLSFVLAVL